MHVLCVSELHNSLLPETMLGKCKGSHETHRCSFKLPKSRYKILFKISHVGMWRKLLFHLRKNKNGPSGVSLVLYCTFMTRLGHMFEMVSLDSLSDIYTRYMKRYLVKGWTVSSRSPPGRPVIRAAATGPVTRAETGIKSGTGTGTRTGLLRSCRIHTLQ